MPIAIRANFVFDDFVDNAEKPSTIRCKDGCGSRQ